MSMRLALGFLQAMSISVGNKLISRLVLESACDGAFEEPSHGSYQLIRVIKKVTMASILLLENL